MTVRDLPLSLDEIVQRSPAGPYLYQLLSARAMLMQRRREAASDKVSFDYYTARLHEILHLRNMIAREETQNDDNAATIFRPTGATTSSSNPSYVPVGVPAAGAGGHASGSAVRTAGLPPADPLYA